MSARQLWKKNATDICRNNANYDVLKQNIRDKCRQLWYVLKQDLMKQNARSKDERVEMNLQSTRW